MRTSVSTARTVGRTPRVREGDETIDSETLLKQGDELLRSSRELLDDLDDVVATDTVTATPDEPTPDEI